MAKDAGNSLNYDMYNAGTCMQPEDFQCQNITQDLVKYEAPYFDRLELVEPPRTTRENMNDVRVEVGKDDFPMTTKTGATSPRHDIWFALSESIFLPSQEQYKMQIAWDREDLARIVNKGSEIYTTDTRRTLPYHIIPNDEPEQPVEETMETQPGQCQIAHVVNETSTAYYWANYEIPVVGQVYIQYKATPIPYPNTPEAAERARNSPGYVDVSELLKYALEHKISENIIGLRDGKYTLKSKYFLDDTLHSFDTHITPCPPA